MNEKKAYLTKLTAFCLIAIFSYPAFSAEKVRIATAANAYPYNYKCSSPEEVCGIEIDLFKSICRSENLDCSWVITPWADQAGPLGSGGILHKLMNPNVDGNYAYDAVISSLSTNAERRDLMLFSIPYYTANHIFIADKTSSKIQLLAFDQNGFILDDSVSVANNQKLKIGTMPGFLISELNRNYANAKNVEIISTTTGDKDLVEGKIDVYFAWSGIEKKIYDLMPGGDKFAILSTAKTLELDPLNGVGVATRISQDGRKLSEVFNKGIISARLSGVHRDLFIKALGVDLWACRIAPNLENDPKCIRQPK